MQSKWRSRNSSFSLHLSDQGVQYAHLLYQWTVIHIILNVFALASYIGMVLIMIVYISLQPFDDGKEHWKPLFWIGQFSGWHHLLAHVVSVVFNRIIFWLTSFSGICRISCSSYSRSQITNSAVWTGKEILFGIFEWLNFSSTKINFFSTSSESFGFKVKGIIFRIMVCRDGGH